MYVSFVQTCMLTYQHRADCFFCGPKSSDFLSSRNNVTRLIPSTQTATTHLGVAQLSGNDGITCTHWRRGTYEEEHEEVVSLMQAYNSMTGLHMLSTPKPYDTDEPIHVFLDLSGVRGAKSAARHQSRSVSGQAHTKVPNFQTVWLPSSNSLSRVCLIPTVYWTHPMPGSCHFTFIATSINASTPPFSQTCLPYGVRY
jgi:hypothetical protein